MKGLSIEQKAKAYDEAIKYAHYLINERCKEGYDGSFHRADLHKMFPELKESEDERVRKDIIVLVKDWWDRVNKDNMSTKDEMLAWLEKQGEHANFRNKIQIGDKVTRNEDGVLVNLSQLKRVAKKDEKQGEQKHTAEEVLIKAGLKPYKDGDQWCILLGDNIQEGICGFGNTIEDALYAFLKDLIASQGEQKPAEWSEEDSKNINSLIGVLDERMNSSDEGTIVYDYYKSLQVWLKSLKDRVLPQPKQEWSEEDVEMYGNVLSTLSICSNNPDIPIDVRKMYQKEYAWFDELYNRIQSQPKQKWSEEDERIFNTIIRDITNDKNVCKYEIAKSICDEQINWLKSLRPQTTWKPSEEQISLLQAIVNEPNNAASESCQITLKEVIRQLKKLKKG